jgi:ribosome biogenesis GTPase A
VKINSQTDQKPANAEARDLVATTADPEDGASRLRALATLAEELDAEELSRESRELADRVSEGRFYVACIGQFKRGKSTLINALVGRPLLPTGFTPVTAVPTVVQFGDRDQARIRTHAGQWKDILVTHLKEYVSEELNPENRKGILAAEVFVPHHLLRSGLCIVDTPGLGSVFSGNTTLTHAFLPHIDAALVVVGADPPLAGDELTLVEAVSKQVDELIVVLNKADRTTDPERAAASKFTRQILQEKLRREVGPIFEVSAKEQAESRGPERDWRKLTQALQRLVDDSGRQLVRVACERGRQRLGRRVLAVIAQHRDTIRRPIEESERRLNVMKQTRAGVERSLRELSVLFRAEQQRLSDALGERHKAFVQSVLPFANAQLESVLRSNLRGFGPAYRRKIMKAAQQIAHSHLAPWLTPAQEEAERQYQGSAMRFVEMGNDFLGKLAEEDIPELAQMPRSLDPELGFRVRSQFTFMEFVELAKPASPLRWLADIILPLIGARILIQNEAREFLLRLIETNSARVQSDILNRAQESRGRLEIEIRKLLHQVNQIGEQALIRARLLRQAGSIAVEKELARLDHLERRVFFLAASPETGPL